MLSEFVLLPQPQQVTYTGGTLTLRDRQLIILLSNAPGEMLFTAQRLQQTLHSNNLQWEIVARHNAHSEQIGLVLTIDTAIPHKQGYQLTITPEQITIAGHDIVGVFYGSMTLIQLLQQCGAELPTLVISDYPDFADRGILLDISRDKVPTMDTLYALIDKFAGWKINQIQLYTEHTFAYRRHPEVWSRASPITAEEILLLDRYCKDRFIDLVPNQNTFGHMHRWFEHSQYKVLAEVEDGFVTPWGERFDYPFSLNPTHPEALKFIDGLFEELLPNFTSPYFNVNCDETFDLGQGRSKDLCETKGREYVYLDFVTEIYKRVKQYGFTMQFWADIVGHYPAILKDIPKDVVALEWGYEANHPFGEKCAALAEAGLPFYVCPGTSSWNSIAGRTENALGNIRSAAEQGLKYGALGILNTDWGDLGHWQSLPVSYPGFVTGAALSWAYRANVDLDLPRLLNTFVFDDQAAVAGQMACALGNTYQQPGIEVFNGNILFWAYHLPLQLSAAKLDSHLARTRDTLMATPGIIQKLYYTRDYIDQTRSVLRSSKMSCPDATILTHEYELAADMLEHGANRLLFMLGDLSIQPTALDAKIHTIREQYCQQWLVRNRVGGLEQSIRILQ